MTSIKTAVNKNFGGFIPLNLEYNLDSLVDEINQTFVFSLNLMKKFDLINKDKTAMLFNWEYGPSLGTSDPRIESNMKRGKIYANKYAYFF